MSLRPRRGLEEKKKQTKMNEKREKGKKGKGKKGKGKKGKGNRQREKEKAKGRNVSKRELHAFVIGNFYRTWLLTEVVVDNLPFLERADPQILHGCDREQSQKFCQIPRVWHGDHFLRDRDVE